MHSYYQFSIIITVVFQSVYKSRIVSVRDGNFFSNRIISTWNSLPDDIVSSRSVDIFKRKLHSMSFSLD